MLAKLLPFELNLQLRQVGFWITFSLVFFISTLFGWSLFAQAGERVLSNGAFSTGQQISNFSSFAIFFSAIFVVSGVMRDEASKALEVIHATPVQTPPMVISRYIGAYAATFLCLLAMVLGLFFAQFFPFIDEATLGPINLIYYLQPILVFVAINALFVTGIFCTVAMVTRSRTLVYVSSVALFILVTISGALVSDDTPKLLASLLDPFGGTALNLETQFWSPAERNTQLAPIQGYVGLNRIVWLSIGLGLFALCFKQFQRGMGKPRKAKRGASASAGTQQAEIKLHALSAPLKKAGLLSLWTRTKFEYWTTIRSVAFIILVGLLLTLAVTTILIRNQLSSDPSLPTNALMAGLVFAGSVIPLLLISIFFSGEIIWRDRVAKMTELVDSTPAPNAVFMAGKWLAMILVILTVVTGGTLLGMSAQMALGDVAINPATHFMNAYMNFAPQIIFYCTLIMFIQNFMPNRIVGMIVGGVAIGIFLIGIPLLPFSHPMMAFGNLPTGGFSEMNGFGNLNAYFWFLLYWLGLAGLFAIASIWLWRRGLQTALSTRLKSLRSQITLPTATVAALCAALFFGGGGFIYSSYESNDFQTQSEANKFLADLEKDLGAEFDTFLPKVRSVEMDVQFYPSLNSVRTTGIHIIENTTGQPLTQLYISGPIDRAENVQVLSLDGAVWSQDTDKEKYHAEQGIRLYKFEQALAPGATTQLRYDLTIPTPTLGGQKIIRENGTFVNNTQIAPRLGLSDFRLRNPDQRRKQDLPEFKGAPDRTDLAARDYNIFYRVMDSADYVNFKATVCTDAGQIPIAPGRAVRIYEQEGRPCRDYVPNEPIALFFSFVSAKYEIAEDTWTAPDGSTVDLAIFYDAQHDYNIELMIKAMKDSLDTFTDVFGPYQYDTLRIMEFPYASFAQSFAGTIPFSENIGFVLDPGDAEDTESVDIATYVTMHEIGHQWFAHQIVPAFTEGFNVLSEGLTEHAAMTAYERTYGWQKARRLLERRSTNQYLTGRTLDSGKELPLATAGGFQQYIVYSKASWVFWGLKHYIGEDQMQIAMRNFLDTYGQAGPPYPTTLELIDELRAAAEPEHQQLITDYFDRLTFWDMKFAPDSLDLSPADNKTYTVDLTLDLDKKIASEKTGRALSILEPEYEKAKEEDEDTKRKLIREAEALNEWIEIGFYDKDPEDTFGDEWLKLERVHITQAKTELSFTLDSKPTYILLDPRRLLIERNVDDNKIELTWPEDES